MTPTEELRALLDGRGVEYDAVNGCVTVVHLKDRYITFLSHGDRFSVEVVYPRPILNGTVYLTPAQAVEATLGSDDGYDAGFTNGVKATLQQLDGLLMKTDSAVEIQAWVDEQWEES